MTGNGYEVTGIMTKYELPFTSSNLLETAPATQSNIGTLNMSVGFGDGKLSGSIGYSIDLSNCNPDITRTEDYTTDTVEWVLTQRRWFPKNIDNAALVCLASWAAVGDWAAIDVSYSGVVNVGLNSQYPTSAGYTKIPVRFCIRD